MVKVSELVSNMKDCKIYIVQVVSNDSDKIFIIEVWESQEEQQASLSSQEVRKPIKDSQIIK